MEELRLAEGVMHLEDDNEVEAESDSASICFFLSSIMSSSITN